MKRRWRRGLSLFLSFIMILGLLPTGALATEVTDAATAVVGDTITVVGSTAEPAASTTAGTHWANPVKSAAVTCGKIEHAHSDSCYDYEDVLICDHTHVQSCYTSYERCYTFGKGCSHEFHYTEGSGFSAKYYGSSTLSCSHSHTTDCYESQKDGLGSGCPTQDGNFLTGYTYYEHTHTEPACYSYTWTLVWNTYNVAVSISGKDGVSCSNLSSTTIQHTGSVSFDLPAMGEIGWVATVKNGETLKGSYTLSETEATTITVSDMTSGDISVELSQQAVYDITLTNATPNYGTASVSVTKAVDKTEVTVTATPAAGNDNTKYSLASITVNGAAISGNTFTINGANAEVVVTFKMEQLTGNSTADIKFDPSKSAADQLDTLKQEIFNKLAVNYVPNGVTYNQLTYEHLYYETYSLMGIAGDPYRTENYVEIGIDPADRDITGGYYTTHPFGYTGLGTVEHVKLTYNGLSIEADVTLVEGRYYDVVWKDADGTILESDTEVNNSAVKHGDTASYGGTTPTKAADGQYTYSFAGWDTDTDGDVDYTTENLPTVTSDMTFTAVYTSTAKAYTVTWNANGGSMNSTTTQVGYGEKVAAQTATKTGYKLLGWYADADLTTAWDFDTNTMPAENITLYAKWEAETYTITVDDTKLCDYTIESGDITLTTPAKTGYTFAGWTGTGLDGATMSVTIAEGSTGNREYTSTWTANSYTIKYDSNGGSGSMENTTATYDADVSLTANAFTRTGYTFAGWNTKADGTGTSYADEVSVKNLAASGEVTLYAQWTANTYTVVYDGNGHTDGSMDDTTATYDADVPLSANAFTRTGYIFAGWNTKADGSGTSYADKASVKNLVASANGSVTLYAQWNAADGISYTVKHHFENLSDGYDVETETKTGKTGELTAAVAQTREGFAAGTVDNVAIAADGNTVVSIYYTRNEYDLTIVFDNGTENSVTKVKYGADLNLPTGLTKTGYTFKGWDKNNTTMPDSDLTVTAQWEINTHTITWVVNGVSTTETYEYGATPSFKSSTDKSATAQYTYAFSGWSPAIAAVTKDETYTAQYTETVNEYTITWVDGDGNTLKTDQVAYGSTPSYSGKTPTKTGTAQYTYTFNNSWSPAITTVTGAATYTAQFSSTVNKYKITFKNDDGTVLQETEVAYGETPVYSGTTPTKTADTYTYTFAGWGTISSVTGEATYTAQYNKTGLNATNGTIKLNGGDWTGVDDDLHTKVLTAAGMPTTGFTVYWNDMELPMSKVQQGLYNGTLQDSIGSTLTFTIVDDTTGLTKDVVMQVKDSRETYATITLGYENGTGFDTVNDFKTAVWNSIEINGEAITLVTGKFEWNSDNNAITVTAYEDSTNLETTKTFENLTWTVNQYTVIFKNEDGAELQNSKWNYGATPSYSGEAPTKADATDSDGNVMATYTHNGWTPAIAAVSGEATYTATFKETAKTYTVIYQNGDGSELQKSTVNYGEDVPEYSETAVPTKTSSDPTIVWVHNGWELQNNASVKDGKVMNNAVYVPTFTTEAVYTINYVTGKDADGNWIVFDTQYINLTQNPEATIVDSPEGNPDAENAFEHKVFSGWGEKVGKSPANYVEEGEAKVVYVEAVWTDEVNNNNVLDENETATVVVAVTGPGTVALSNSGNSKIFITETATAGTYTVVYDSTDATDGDKVYVIETPTATEATEVENYVTDPVEYVTVADGETVNVDVTFAEHALGGSDGTIDGNGSSVELKKEALTKETVLKAILGAETVAADSFNASEYTVKMYVQLADVPVLGTISGYYDIWALNDLGDTLSNMIWQKAVDIPGTESFEITWEKSGYPIVSGIYTVTLTDARPVAEATHNGDTYNASALDDTLLAEIEKDLTAPDGVTFTVKWADTNPAELVEGESYQVSVVVALAETEDYRGNTQTVTVTVNVPITKASITISETANMTYNTGMTDADKVQMVLDVVKPVFVPESLENEAVTVWYKANEARSVPLTINFAAMDLGVYGYMLPDSTTIQVAVSDMWMNIGVDFPETKAPTNEQLEEILLDLIEKHGADFLAGDMTEEEMYDILAITLKQHPDIKLYYEYLGAHKFGENETTDAEGNVLETVYVAQADTGYGALKSNEAVLTLADLRTETTIKLNTGVAVTYSGYTVDGLKTALVEGVYDADGNRIGGAELVEFVTDVSNLPASEATEITVKYAGDTDYKSSTATETIVVNKAAVTVAVDNQVVKYGTEYNKLPVSTTPADVDTIQFIVGLDISNVNVDTSEGASLGAIKGIMGSVQLLLPEELQALLEMADGALQTAGLNISFANGASMKLSELQESVDILADLFQGSEYEEYFNVLLNMLKSLPTDTADVEVIIGGNLPSNVGVYLIGAVTADENYETAVGVGVLAIYPDGIKAELDWKMDDDNYIITRSLLTSGVFDADAEAVSVGEGGTLEEATEQAFEIFLGVDIDGNITLEDDQSMLNVGAYVEVAMIVNWGNQMYYSEPIARPFVVVAETLDVEFIDANGDVNNERWYVFDNTAKDGMEGKDELLVTYKQDGVGYSAGDKLTDYIVKYYYVGVQTNGIPYASTSAPVHAGAYTITAIVTVRDAAGDITHAGQGVGALVIEPAESDVSVDNAAVRFDNQGHGVNDLVTATSAVPGLTPDTTIISAGVALDRNSSLNGLDAVVGTVNVDLPKWLDEVMTTLNILEAGYADGITATTFLGYVEKVQNALEELGVDTAAFAEIVNVIEQMPEDVTLTFHDDKTYSDVGAYLVVAVVTDSDHYPSADVGIMVIYPDATKVELKFEEDWNGNNIFTWNALQSLNLDAQAYDMGTDSVNAGATELVTNIYLGIIDDGEIVLTNDKSTLDNGVFTQVAFLLDLGTTMYYAEPVSRVFMIVPNPYTITFVDENGAENADRVFTFDNTAHEMDVVVKDTNGNVVTDLSGLTITYTGVQTNLKTYNREEAPVHAGTYVVTATYTARDEQDRLVTLGVEAGAMVILPAEAGVEVNSEAIPYDGHDHSINDMVVVTSTVENVSVDKTVITASINTDGSFSENLLNAIEGSVNVDLPSWVDNILANYENAADGVSITGFLSVIEDVKAELTENDIDTSVFDELVSVLEQLPGDLTLTFEDDYQRKAVGIYLVIGAVTDSDHMPAVDVGYLIIYPDVVDTELKFNNLDANGIFTNELMAGFDFAATAYGENGDVIDEATEQIQYIYFGMDSDGKLVVTGGLDAVQNLNYGVYTQVAFIAEIDSVIYLAEPIARPVIRVPNTVNVDFEDVVANYNGTNIGIGSVTITKLNGDAFARNDEALTVYYAGISTNGQPYWSETAPVHAGVYSVIALYVDGENIGAHVGSVTIKSTEVGIDVSSQAVKYGTEYDITVTVDPADDSIDPADAKYLLITAGTDASVSGGALGLSSINTINLDFPEAVDSVLEKLNITDGVTIGDFVAVADSIQSALDKIGYESEYMAQVVDLLNQMGSGVTVTFEDDYEPTNVGVYFLIATIFDPDYMPAVDTGVLVIYPNGELVDIEFTTPIPGALNIMPYNTVVDFDFSAYTDSGETFDSLINNVIFGLTTDGELFVGDGNAEGYAGNPNELGAYTQVAYIKSDLNGLDGEMYVAIPEFRLFSVVKCDYDVIFVDETGAENDERIFTYDGTAKSMEAIIVNAQGSKLDIEPTVWYIGVDTGLDATWSTTAPTNAGTYSTVAYYFDEAENIYVMATGMMVIQKAEMVLDLLDTTVTYDGTPKFVDVDNEENTDFVYAIIDRTKNVMNIVLDDDLDGALDLLKKYGIEPKTSYDADKVLGAIKDAMDELAVTTEYGTVRSVLNKLQSIIPNDGTVTINDNDPVDAGVYEVYAFAYEVVKTIDAVFTITAAENDNCEHIDKNADHKCDTCSETISQCADEDPADHKCDTCGETVSECSDEDGDDKCDVCGKDMGGETPDEPGITYSVKNYTGNEDAETWTVIHEGATINVRNDLACVVLIEHVNEDGTSTYTRLAAVAQDDGSYNFDISAIQDGEYIVIAVKGDGNLDGKVTMADGVYITRSCVSNEHAAYRELDAFEEILLDLDGNGKVTMADQVLITRSCVSTTHAAYKEIAW